MGLVGYTTTVGRWPTLGRNLRQVAVAPIIVRLQKGAERTRLHGNAGGRRIRVSGAGCVGSVAWLLLVAGLASKQRPDFSGMGRNGPV